MPLKVKLNHDADKMSEALGFTQEELERLVDEYLQLKKEVNLRTKFLEKVCQEEDDRRLLFFILTFGIDQGIDIGREQMIQMVSESLAALPTETVLTIVAGLASQIMDKKEDPKNLFGLN